MTRSEPSRPEHCVLAIDSENPALLIGTPKTVSQTHSCTKIFNSTDLGSTYKTWQKVMTAKGNSDV